MRKGAQVFWGKVNQLGPEVPTKEGAKTAVREKSLKKAAKKKNKAS